MLFRFANNSDDVPSQRLTALPVLGFFTQSSIVLQYIRSGSDFLESLEGRSGSDDVILRCCVDVESLTSSFLQSILVQVHVFIMILLARLGLQKNFLDDFFFASPLLRADEAPKR